MLIDWTYIDIFTETISSVEFDFSLYLSSPKAKAGNDKKKECVGLYTYPVLQSADILLYK